MQVGRRTLFTGTAALAVVGGLGLAACSSSSSSSSSSAAGSITFDAKAWSYDADNDVYYQLGRSYVATPQAPDYETLGVYVPGAYLTATKNSDGTYTGTLSSSGTVNGFTAATAPVVLPVNTPGYAAQRPPSAYSYSDVSAYMKAGYVYVAAGLRGKDSETSSYTGNAPWGVVDLKAAVRYLRRNASTLPGSKDHIFVFGHSGGGAQSTIMGASGDSALYTPYLTALGAAMTDSSGATISDAIHGVMAWCPITSLDYGNAAYEWNMGQFASSGTRASGTWTAAYSKDLAAAFPTHLNALGLKDSSGNALSLAASSSGTYLSGSYYDYLVGVITTSLNNFLSDTTFPYTPSSSTMAGMPGGTSGGPAPSGGTMPSGAMPSGMPGSDQSGMPSGGQSGMPGGSASGGTGGAPGGTSTASSTTYATAQDYIDHLNSSGTWVIYNAGSNTATVSGLQGFVTSQKSASKDVGAFDGIARGETENVVMGLGTAGLHFAQVSRDVIKTNESSYSAYSDWKTDYASSQYDSDFAKTDGTGKDVATRLAAYTPMYYLNSTYAGYKTSTVAPAWRIRTGIMQGDTANTTEVNLALALANFGISAVDFATVWGQAHTMAERTGDGATNFIAWVAEHVS